MEKNISAAVQAKVEKLEASKRKWETIFEKSENTRAASVANLELALAKKRKMAEQIAAKKAKVLGAIDAKIAATKLESDDKPNADAAAEAQVLAQLEAEDMTKEFYAG